MKPDIRSIVKEEVRKKILFQERQRDIQSCIDFCDFVINEQKDKALLNEFDLGELGSGIVNLAGGFFDTLPEGGKNLAYEFITGLILDAIADATGMSAISTESMFGKFLRNFIPEFAERDGIDTVMRFVSTKDPNACKELVEAVLVGFIETPKEEIFDERIIPDMLNVVSERIFGQPMDPGMIARFAGSISRETINEMIESYIQPMIIPVSEFLCVHQDVEKFKDALMNMSAGGPTRSSRRRSLARSSGRQETSNEDLYIPEDPADLIRRIMREQ